MVSSFSAALASGTGRGVVIISVYEANPLPLIRYGVVSNLAAVPAPQNSITFFLGFAELPLAIALELAEVYSPLPEGVMMSAQWGSVLSNKQS